MIVHMSIYQNTLQEALAGDITDAQKEILEQHAPKWKRVLSYISSQTLAHDIPKAVADENLTWSNGPACSHIFLISGKVCIVRHPRTTIYHGPHIRKMIKKLCRMS